ncbi:protein-tyrosine kinase [Azoarcus sp. KH32C]|nr:protein-tyrosine kinase [Azoarcus sp. KH32C]
MPQQQKLAPQIAEDDDEIDLLRLFGTLVDHKWLIGGVTAAFCVAGIAYSTLATPIYRADAMVQVEKKAAGIPGLSDVGEMLGKESKALTEIELIKSRSVIGKAVDNLRLDVIAQPVRLPLLGKWFARRFKPSAAGEVSEARFGLSSYAWGGERIELFRFDLPSYLIDRDLELTVGEDGRYAVVDDDGAPLLEGRVGDEVQSGEIRILVSDLAARPGTRFRLRRADRIKTVSDYQKNVEVSERGKDTGIIALALEDSDPRRAAEVLDEISKQFVRQNVERMSAEAASSLEFLRGQLPQVRKELEKAESALNAYQTRSRTVDISMEAQAVLNQTVALETQISTLRMQQAEMDRKLTPEHPRYQALVSQLAELTRQKAALTGKIQNLPETQQEVLRLARDVKVSTEIYTLLLNKTQELDVVRAGTVGNARVIDSAVTLAEAVKPKKALIVLVATLLGAISGTGFVLVRRALNPGLESPEAIEQLGLPVYAAVPFSEQQRIILQHSRRSAPGRPADMSLLAVRHPHDLAVESLRSLRTSLHFAMLEANNNRLMISGPSPAVGKSFISANLAAIVAQAGQRVLLVDADMRKGHLHKLLGTDAENGLSDLLVRRCDLATAIRDSAVENLSFIPRGQIPPNPSELLMHANFTAFLDEVGKQFDLVIVDTPPLLAVTDAAVVGRHAGTSLIVTRFGMNPAREIELTLRRFAQNGIEIKGAIFNGVEKRASAYGYGSYRYYQYEYKSEKA